MIDLEKLRELAAAANTAEDWYAAHDMTSCSYDYDKAFIAASAPVVVLELLDHIAALEKDAGRLDWLETITKLNSEGSRTYGMETERNALFTIMPAWYQDKKRHENLRQSIDTAMESKHG